MASDLQWIPESLYNAALSALVVVYSKVQKEIRTLPENVQFDIYYKLYKQGRLCQLGIEFCELDVFARMLKVNDKRHYLHHCFQALMDHGVQVSKVLADSYCQRSYVAVCGENSTNQTLIQLGISLGNFLSDAGWFVDGERIIVACLQLCQKKDDPFFWGKSLECCLRLIHVRNAYCKFDDAELVYEEANKLLNKFQNLEQKFPLAALFAEFSSLFFVKSQYDKAYYWSLEALKKVSPYISVKTVIDVLKQAAKACVVKRDFKRAEMVIKQAVYLARENFGPNTPKYADVLLDYGFYLLNVDLVGPSVQVYQAALDCRQALFGGNNLHVATAHEDLAYASYVYEYSSGKFSDAHDHADKALQIMKRILPEDHLLLASSKRVKALILEEIAIDNQDKETGHRLLAEAQDLHMQALHLTQSAFGEINVQTAKHYGNLGRLYQSMKRYEEAEKMHLKAISIKEMLLGPDDYEVALSVGHLASLYNYDMARSKDAEQLYQRSIAIAKKLFGDGYSGLEYDYRGLLRVHSKLGNHTKAIEYTRILHEWKQIHDKKSEKQISPLEIKDPPQSTETVIYNFFLTTPATLSGFTKE